VDIEGGRISWPKPGGGAVCGRRRSGGRRTARSSGMDSARCEDAHDGVRLLDWCRDASIQAATANDSR
jgi:hypothetical protein